jgi:hypothetical protein
VIQQACGHPICLSVLCGNLLKDMDVHFFQPKVRSFRMNLKLWLIPPYNVPLKQPPALPTHHRTLWIRKRVLTIETFQIPPRHRTASTWPSLIFNHGPQPIKKGNTGQIFSIELLAGNESCPVSVVLNRLLSFWCLLLDYPHCLLYCQPC